MGEAKTALIGSGDFAEQVADLGRESEIEVVGMFDGNRPKGSLVAGIPVLGNDDDVEPMFKDGSVRCDIHLHWICTLRLETEAL